MQGEIPSIDGVINVKQGLFRGSNVTERLRRLKGQAALVQKSSAPSHFLRFYLIIYVNCRLGKLTG